MKTLICIRKLPYSENTVSLGELFADLVDTSITLMTVAEERRLVPEKEAALNRIRRELRLEDARIKVRVGDVIDEILDEADEGEYDYIVIGSRQLDGILDFLLADVPSRVAGKAETSVLVARQPSQALRKILIPVGGQKMRKRVVRAGAELARRAEALVTILYVTDPVPSMYTGLDALDESLEELLSTDTPIAKHLRWSAEFLSGAGVEANIKLRHGVTSDEIMREARQGEYDLVVLGAPALKGPLQRLLMDQVTPQVVDKAVCSVLVVR